MPARMKLEEKVGQIRWLETRIVTTGTEQGIPINSAKAEEDVVKYSVGSILGVEGT